MAVSRPSSLSSGSSRRKKRSPKNLEQELGGLMPPFSPELPQVFNDHAAVTRRLKKTLYYGKKSKMDRPSLCLTDISVECFNSFEDGLDRLDVDLACNLTRDACLSPCTLVLGLTYLGRLSKMNPNYLHSVSSSRLFLVSVMVASKFLYDEGEDDDIMNDEWAHLSRLDIKELNALEREFLHAIDWKVFVSKSQFRDVLTRVEQKIAMEQALKRGWFSYTDLTVLCPSAPPWEIYRQIIQALSGCFLLYATSLASIWSATVMLSHALPVALEASNTCSTALDKMALTESLVQYALLALSLTQRLSLSMIQSHVNESRVGSFLPTYPECGELTPSPFSCDCSAHLGPSSPCLCYLIPTPSCEMTQPSQHQRLPVFSDMNTPSSLFMEENHRRYPSFHTDIRHASSGPGSTTKPNTVSTIYDYNKDSSVDFAPTSASAPSFSLWQWDNSTSSNMFSTDDHDSMMSASSIQKWDNGTSFCLEYLAPIMVKG